MRPGRRARARARVPAAAALALAFALSPPPGDMSRRRAHLPFCAPMSSPPLGRLVAGSAQVALRALGLRPLPAAAAPAHVRPLCAASGGGGKGGGGGGCDEPEVRGLVDRLLSLVVQPALARNVGKEAAERGAVDSGKAGADEATRPELALRYPAVDRIVAIGDVHGDMGAFSKSLKAAGIVDEEGQWAGGKTVLVQVGDQLDRGDDEREIYDTLFRLQDTAPQSGGAVHILLGNHELINFQQDFRYVTEGGFSDFERGGGLKPLPKSSKLRIPPPMQKRIKALPKSMQARARALSPGGPLAVELARRAQVAVIVGDNVFVHGGLSPQHLTYGGKAPEAALRTLAGINEDCRDYMLGIAKRPMVLRGGNSPVWMRDYSNPRVRPGSDSCRMLAETLKMLRARRMIVGHTPQDRGINAACGGKVWRIDTGMSAVYGGVPEAMEITKRGDVRIFNASEGVIQGSARAR